MRKTKVKRAQRPIRVSTLTGTLVILAVIVLLVLLKVILAPDVPPLAREVQCRSNMKHLFLCLAVYAENHGDVYPTAETWCDLLVEMVGEEGDDPNAVERLRWALRCPGGPEGRCHYAINPQADPCSVGDVVLLFESTPGWNRFGGAKLLTTENHEGRGGNVVFVDGAVRLVKAGELGALKRGDEKRAASAVRNARRPGSDAELEYWLANMI